MGKTKVIGYKIGLAAINSKTLLTANLIIIRFTCIFFALQNPPAFFGDECFSWVKRILMTTVLAFLGGVGTQELLLIGIFVLIFFGAKKIPEFMKSLGKGAREFKEGINSYKKDIEDDEPSADAAGK